MLQLAGRLQDHVSQLFGAEASEFPPRSDRSRIGVRLDDVLDQNFERPIVLDQVDRQVVQKIFGDRGRTGDTQVVGGGD